MEFRFAALALFGCGSDGESSGSGGTGGTTEAGTGGTTEAGTGGTTEAGTGSTDESGTDSSEVDFEADVWADNWFAMYRDGELIAEDSVPITTEKSFNAESFTFGATYPFTLAVVIKDFKENDTGLEYIGAPNQQMGDGGFIAQIKDTGVDKVAAVTNSGWRCLVIHRAPLNKDCEKDSNPVDTCQSESIDEPAGWKDKGFDDSGWVAATEYTEAAVGPGDGYDKISWEASAKLIWTSDLETDNTLLCRLTVTAP